LIKYERINTVANVRNCHDIIYPNDIVQKRVEYLAANDLPFPAHGKNGVLIYGPYGTGKSTLARVFVDDLHAVRKLESPYDVHKYIVAAGHNGASLIQELTQVASEQSGWYTGVIFIIDEVDNLGAAAMKSLKSVMDLPRTALVMTTNNLESVDGGIIDRCHLIDMSAPKADRWMKKARQFLKDKGVKAKVTDRDLRAIVESCNGSVRQILNELEYIAVTIK
jgi:replication-associated recombination protein RarA